jgi:hypothetical protein
LPVLFSGFFIVADAPYKIGDYINLDTGERGKVSAIGLRSTRSIQLGGTSNLWHGVLSPLDEIDFKSKPNKFLVKVSLIIKSTNGKIRPIPIVSSIVATDNKKIISFRKIN